MKLFKTKALVGSAAQVEIGNREQQDELRRIRSLTDWQERAWCMYRDSSALHYPVQFVGHAMARVRLVAARRNDETGKYEPDVSKNLPNTLLEDLDQGFASTGLDGVAGLMYGLGVHFTLVGESYLYAEETPDGNSFSLLSTSELEVSSSGNYRRRKHMADRGTEDLPEDAKVFRLWVPDPEWQQVADSPVHPLLDTFDELERLSDSLGAIDRSRVPAGILLVPSEMSFGKRGFPGFVQDLIEHLKAPIENRKSASSVTPLAIEGPSEYLDHVRLISLERETVGTDIERMSLLHKRIGVGIPLPAEIMSGKEGLTHWASYLTSADVWQAIQPLASIVTGGLTQVWFRPALRAQDFPDPHKWRIQADPSDQNVRPDAIQVASDGLDRLAISEAAWRRAAEYTEDDAPSSEEYIKRAALGRATAPIGPTGKPGQPSSDIGRSSVDRRGAPSSSPPPPPSEPAMVAAAEDDSDLRHLAVQLMKSDVELRQRLFTSGEMAMQAAVRQLGAKIRTRLGKAQGEQLKSADNLAVAATLGPTKVRMLGIDDKAVLTNALSGYIKDSLAAMTRAQSSAVTAAAKAADIDPKMVAASLQSETDNGVAKGSEMFMAGMIDLALKRAYDPNPPEPTTGEIGG
ncbi:MAG: hypothetical protein ACR2M4_03120 [Actinomycetota bacterium]